MIVIIGIIIGIKFICSLPKIGSVRSIEHVINCYGLKRMTKRMTKMKLICILGLYLLAMGLISVAYQITSGMIKI